MDKKVHNIIFFRRNTMERKQLINCTVSSCAYNNGEKNMCELKSIQVEPMEDVHTKTPDESMCASYECDE